MKPEQPEKWYGGKGAVRPERPNRLFYGSEHAYDHEKRLSDTRY